MQLTQRPVAPTARSSCSSRAQHRNTIAARQRVLKLRAAATETVETAANGAGLPTEKSGNSLKAVMDIEQIKAVLPHRYPFLLVDRVVELEPQKYAIGYKNITANDQFFNGHFPQRAIMPGVLQIEALAQLGGLVMLDPNADEASRNNFFFGGIEGCKFRKPVVPGDILMLRVDLTKFNKRFGIAKMAAKAFVGEDLVCEAELTLVMGK